MKNKMMVLMLGFLLMANSSSAKENKFVVQGGGLHTNSSTRGDSGVGVIRYERSVTDWLSVGPEYSYHGPFTMRSDDGTPYGQFSAHVFMADAIIYPPALGKFQGYIGAAAGGALYDFQESADIKARGIVVDTDWSFAKKYFIGLDYDLGHDWILNVEWYFYETNIRKAGHYLNGDFSNILDTGKTLGNGETSIMLGVGKKFDTLKDLFS